MCKDTGKVSKGRSQIRYVYLLVKHRISVYSTCVRGSSMEISFKVPWQFGCTLYVV